MRNKMVNVILSGFVVFMSLFFFFHPTKAATTVPGGPPLTGAALSGNCTDGVELRCSTYYGQAAAVNSGWIQENGTGVGVAASLNAAITPANVLDVNGTTEIGGGSAPSANGSVQFKVTALNASTTGQIINNAASSTSDILLLQMNGVNVAQFNSGQSNGTSSLLSSATFQVGGGTFTVTSVGHLRIKGAGANPSVSSCGGGSPAIVSGASDTLGSVTTGTGSNASCTITFGNAFTNAPLCFCQDNTVPSVCIVNTITTTSMVLKSSATFQNSDVLTWQCYDN